MKRAFLPALVLATLTTSASAQSTPAASGEPVKLQLNLPQGQSYGTRMTMQQKISQTIQGMRMDISTNTVIGMTMKVLEVDAAGDMAVETRYTSFKLDTTVGSGERKYSMSYDSTRPQQASTPDLKMLSAMTGLVLVMKMSPSGEVKEIRGLDEMWEKIIAKMETPKGVNRADFVKSMKAMQSQFGDQNVQNMSGSMATFPTEPVRIGEAWSKKASLSTGFPVAMQSKYTLQSLENGVANINVKSILQVASGSSSALGSKDIKFNLSGTHNGTLTVNQATGWTDKADFEYRFSGRMSMPQPGQPGKTMSWPIYSKGTIKLEPMTATATTVNSKKREIPAPDEIRIIG